MASDKRFLVFEVCRGCNLVIENESFPIDLIPIPLSEFDVIVGMD